MFKDLLINEIFSALSTNTDDYILNRYLIDNIISKRDEEEDFYGVVFISAKDTPGINFAIYGKAIDKLKPAIVNLIKITDIDDYGCIGYELLKNSSPKNGTLIWPEYDINY